MQAGSLHYKAGWKPGLLLDRPLEWWTSRVFQCSVRCVTVHETLEVGCKALTISKLPVRSAASEPLQARGCLAGQRGETDCALR